MDGSRTTRIRHGAFSLRQGLSTLLMLAAYLFLAAVSHAFTDPFSPFALIWLPTGFATGLLLRQGARALPVLVLGVMLSAVFDHAAFARHADALVASSLSHVLVPIILWRLIRRVSQTRPPFHDYLGYLYWLGAILVSFAASSLALLSLTPLSDGNAPPAGLPGMADVLGILVLSPLLLVPVGHFTRPRVSTHLAEGFGWLLALVSVVWVSRDLQLHALYLLLPLLIWAATRFSGYVGLVSVSMTVLAGTEILTHAHALVPYMPRDEFVLLHLLVICMAAASLYVRVLLEDRRRVQNSLEHLVDERTRSLQLMNYELRDEIFVREQAEKSFRRSSRHYRALVETAANPIVVIDEHGNIRRWNSAAEQLYGYGRDAAIGLNFLKAFTAEAFRDEMAWKITKAFNSSAIKETIESEVTSFDGTRHVMLWNINRLSGDDEEDETPLVILVGQDISEIRQTQDRLHYLAHYDVLTDTANRRLFEDRCQQAIASALRHGHHCALINLDVDHFKRINDSLGHDAGDTLLRTLAERLKACVRKEDTVARLGGDEFAVLLYQVSGPDGCDRVARNILEAITRPVSVPGGELTMTSSLGIALSPDDGTHYDTLLKHADMAMYRAKQNGRNTLAFFSEDMNIELQRQLALERDLRQALDQGQALDLHYQPVVDLHSGEVVALEALLRWNHPELGQLSPDAFLGIADQSGLLPRLGEWVCYNACLQARAIHAMQGGPLQLNINVSARQYHHPHLAELLERIMRETRIPPHLIALEIDESILSEDLKESRDILNRLKALGIQLVVDRFGSGLLSVRQLQQLPFDVAKIDRELIDAIPNDPKTTALVQTLMLIAKQLNLQVIAGGVEQASQCSWLQEHGCRAVQGYYCAPPVASNELAQLFHTLRHERPWQAAASTRPQVPADR